MLSEKSEYLFDVYLSRIRRIFTFPFFITKLTSDKSLSWAIHVKMKRDKELSWRWCSNKMYQCSRNEPLNQKHFDIWHKTNCPLIFLHYFWGPMPFTQGVKARTLSRQNERNFCYVRLALTSIFGLCFVPVCLIKSNYYSLLYSSLTI